MLRAHNTLIHTHSLLSRPRWKEGRERIVKLSISAFGDLSLNLVPSIRADIGCVESKKPEVAHSIGHTWGVGCRLADLGKRSSDFNSFPETKGRSFFLFIRERQVGTDTVATS